MAKQRVTWNKTNFVSLLRDRLKDKLEEKTNWGKNQVMEAFNEAVSDVLWGFVDDAMENRSNEGQIF